MTTISSRYFNQHTSKVQKAAEQAPAHRPHRAAMRIN